MVLLRLPRRIPPQPARRKSDGDGIQAIHRRLIERRAGRALRGGSWLVFPELVGQTPDRPSEAQWFLRAGAAWRIRQRRQDRAPAEVLDLQDFARLGKIHAFPYTA